MYRPRIDADVEMTTRDGVTLTADLYRPAEEGRWPVLLHRTPYNRRDSFRVSGIVADPLWLARQGFAVLVQDTRGRFQSGGEFDFITQEYNDSYDAIDWAATQSWSEGNVGIYGSSYLGMAVLQAVAARNPHLKAAVAMVATADMHHTARPGGVFELGFLTTYGLVLCLEGLDHSPLTADERKQVRKQLTEAFADPLATVRRLPLTGIGPLDDDRVAPFWADWLRSPNDPFWRRPTLLTEPERVTIPFLQVTGYQDFTSPTQFRLATALADNENARLVAGPWTHFGAYTPSGQVGSRVLAGASAGVPTWNPVLAAFFDRHLRGGDGADYPAADRYLSGPGRVTYFVGGSDTWAHAPAWPPASTIEEWALGSGGDARTAEGNGKLTRPGTKSAEARPFPILSPPTRTNRFRLTAARSSWNETRRRPRRASRTSALSTGATTCSSTPVSR
ncbi:CocE/NonD family hydrolase [Nocardia brasiliensis]|uniref:CocE/NonD family hydrolase n=1 Tax=Nocardia brasiliensis TaxID=37326 RepID=UPI003D77679E